MAENSKIKRRMLVFLDETAKHYNIDNRSFNDFQCSYIPEDPSTSEGCAIGRKLPKSYKKKIEQLDLNVDVSVRELFKKTGVPKYFNDMPMPFLEQVQSLHDDDNFWCRNGLTNTGKNQVERIKKRFELHNI